MSQDHAFDFDLAGGIARRLAPAGRELIDKLVETSKKLATPPAPQPNEFATDGDASNSLPIPKASNSRGAAEGVHSTHNVKGDGSSDSNEDSGITLPPLEPTHQLVTPSDLYLFGNATKPSPPRLEQDLKIKDETDIVPAQSPPLPERGKSAFGDPLIAPIKGHYHLIPKNTELPEGLAVVADGENVHPSSRHPETHHTIYPTRAMTAAEFIDKFSQIETTLAGKKKESK